MKRCMRLMIVALAVFVPASMGLAGELNALIIGGGRSHDFERWFGVADASLLKAAGAQVTYTEQTGGQADAIGGIDLLYLSNNKPFADQATKDAIVGHVQAGKGLLLVHSALWHNWNDWPEFNRELCGGGARGHDDYGPVSVEVLRPDHPVMQGVPHRFEITDELYYFEPDTAGAEIEVLARAYSKIKNEWYPVIFTVKSSQGRIVAMTLGHDGAAHQHQDYQTILTNAWRWIGRESQDASRLAIPRQALSRDTVQRDSTQVGVVVVGRQLLAVVEDIHNVRDGARRVCEEPDVLVLPPRLHREIQRLVVVSPIKRPAGFDNVHLRVERRSRIPCVACRSAVLGERAVGIVTAI